MSLYGAARKKESKQATAKAWRDQTSMLWPPEPILQVLGRASRSLNAAQRVNLSALPGSDPREGQPSHSWGDAACIPLWWKPPVEHPSPRRRVAAVATYARRLMAQERRRIRRSTPLGGLHGQRR